MTLVESMLEEFERSLPTTRRHLERVPEDKLMWRPAEKSMTLGQLALHLAHAPGEVARMGVQGSVEIPDNSAGFPQPASVAEILKTFEESAEALREALRDLSDERLQAPISFTRNGEVMMSWPRGLFLRDVMLNHNYHHRGQLSVYFRLLDVPVPVSFGPTADEQMPPPPPSQNA